MKTRKLLFGMLFITVASMVMLPMASAQLDSLAVWENIAGGVLTSTWAETSNANWKGQNVSGIVSYNCTTNEVNWTYNTSVKGERWFHTWEITSTDAETGIGSALMKDATHYYATMYYLDFNGTGPHCFVIYYDAGTIYYWNGTGYEVNVSNATDYTDLEKDYTSDYVRIKALWNWNQNETGVPGNCSVRFKLWEPAGTEYINWIVDDIISYFPGDTAKLYYPGIVCDGSYDTVPSNTLFRRIFFWNLSYDLYEPVLPATVWSQIICPTYDAMDFYYFLLSLEDDLWNNTQLLKAFENTWDLTSFYTNDFYDGAGDDYNDTTYVFTNMLVDFRDFWEQLYPDTPLPDEVPDNTLMVNVYAPFDAKDNKNDYMLIRIDSDNNGVYEDHDYAFWVNASGLTTGTFYYGWTPRVDPDEWFGAMGENWMTTGDIGEMFADHGYHVWSAYINWDLLYNGSSGQRIGTSKVGMSIAFYNANDTLLNIWQDFDETEDTVPYPATEEHNGTLNPTFLGFNDSGNWGMFWVDESLGGGDPMADPDDSAYDDVDATTNNLVKNILPTLIAILLIVAIISIAFSVGFTKDGLITILIVTVLGVILIQIIMSL